MCCFNSCRRKPSVPPALSWLLFNLEQWSSGFKSTQLTHPHWWIRFTIVYVVQEHQQDSYRHSTSTLVNHIHYGTHSTRIPTRFISTQHIHIGESYSLWYTWYKNTNKTHIDTAPPHWWIIFTTVHMVQEQQQDSYRHSISTLVNHIHYGTHGTRTPTRLISTQHIHIGESLSLRYTWYKNNNKIHIDTARPHWWIIFTMVQEHQQDSYRHSTSTLVNHIHHGTRTPTRFKSTQHIHIGESYSLWYKITNKTHIDTAHPHWWINSPWYKNTNKIHIDTAHPHCWIIFTTVHMVQEHQQDSYRHSTSTLVNHIHYGTRSPTRLISTQHIHIGELIHHGTRSPTRFISTQHIHIGESYSLWYTWYKNTNKIHIDTAHPHWCIIFTTVHMVQEHQQDSYWHSTSTLVNHIHYGTHGTRTTTKFTSTRHVHIDESYSL